MLLILEVATMVLGLILSQNFIYVVVGIEYPFVFLVIADEVNDPGNLAFFCSR